MKALEGGGRVTVNDIKKRFEPRLRIRLEKLRARGIVVREGKGGAHREFTYRLVRPDVAAKAIREKGGGLARAAKDRLEQRECPDCMIKIACARSRCLEAFHRGDAMAVDSTDSGSEIGGKR